MPPGNRASSRPWRGKWSARSLRTWPAWKTTDEIFKGKKVALFAVPGAFTGTCHKMHVPSIMQNADALRAKGVNTIAVTAVNDVFVMDAWKKATAADKIDFLADGNLLLIAKGEDGPPSARPRIAGASAIGMDDHMRLAHPSIP